MKIAVIIPPVEDFYFTYHRFSYMGAVRITEILRKIGNHETEIINFPVMGRSQLALPRYLDYLKKYIIPGETGSCSFFSVFRRYGPDLPVCAEIIKKSSPDMIMFSLFAYCYAEPAVSLAEILRKKMPEIPLVCGGAGVSVFPGYFESFFDYVLEGEGEITIPPFLDRINNADKTCPPTGRHTENGEFELSVNIAASDRKSVSISALLSRGCNNRCRFCSNFITHGRNFRKVPLSSVKESLLSRKEIFNPHSGKKFYINFEDDNLLTDKDYFFEIIDIFTGFFSQFAAGDEKNIFFSAENGLDYTLLPESTCQKLIEKNFRQFNFTMGSLKSDIIRSENRSGNNSKLENLLIYLGKKSVPAVTYFIAGLKNDTPETVVDSLLFIARNPGISGISMFYAVPGLPDFSNPDYFRLKPPGLLRGSSAYPWNSSLTTSELITAFRISRTVNLFKKESLTEDEVRLKDAVIGGKKLMTLERKGKELSLIEPPEIDRKMESLFFSKYRCPAPM